MSILDKLLPAKKMYLQKEIQAEPDSTIIEGLRIMSMQFGTCCIAAMLIEAANRLEQRS